MGRANTRRMTKRWLTILICTLAACGSKKTDERAHDEPAAKAEGSAAAKVAAADLFTGSTVTLPTPAAKLRFGMTEAEAKAAAPELFAGAYGYEVPGTAQNYRSVKIVVQIEKGKVWNIRAELVESQDSAKAWLTQKWGAPVEKKNSIGTPEYYWNAPATGLRAKLEQSASSSTVYFSQIMPRDQLLGADPKHFGFESTPLVGAAKDDALKALAAYAPAPRAEDPDDILVTLLPIESELEGIGSSLDLRIKDGKVSGYTFNFVNGDQKDVDALVAKLEGMYGKGKPDSTGLYLDYPAPTKVRAEIRRDAGFGSTVWVGDYRK